MSNLNAQKNMHNYLYDSPELKESVNYKKVSSCNEILDCLGPACEAWIFQCPKGYDPKDILNQQLGKLSKNNTHRVEANRYKDSKHLVCLAPEMTIGENEAVHDNVRLIKTVGKIFITENIQSPKKSRSNIIENHPEITQTTSKKKKTHHDPDLTIVKLENTSDTDRRKKKKKKSKENDTDNVDSTSEFSPMKKKIKIEEEDY